LVIDLDLAFALEIKVTSLWLHLAQLLYVL
jgi:hypothetical protein